MVCNCFARIEEFLMKFIRNRENYHGSITDRLALGGFCFGATAIYASFWVLGLCALIPGANAILSAVYCVLALGGSAVFIASHIYAKFKKWS